MRYAEAASFIGLVITLAVTIHQFMREVRLDWETRSAEVRLEEQRSHWPRYRVAPTARVVGNYSVIIGGYQNSAKVK